MCSLFPEERVLPGRIQDIFGDIGAVMIRPCFPVVVGIDQFAAVKIQVVPMLFEAHEVIQPAIDGDDTVALMSPPFPRVVRKAE
jgi:hypothetical protein